MFQKCPICDGNGYPAGTVIRGYTNRCQACKGHGIINQQTGLPPEPTSGSFTANDAREMAKAARERLGFGNVLPFKGGRRD